MTVPSALHGTLSPSTLDVTAQTKRSRFRLVLAIAALTAVAVTALEGIAVVALLRLAT